MAEETKKNCECEEESSEACECEKDEKLSRKDKKNFDKLQEELGKMTAEANVWKNKYYEAYADMANLRKSIEKDHQQMVKYSGQKFVEGMLPALDNFYMAFKVTPEDPTLAAYCKGFEMIYRQLYSALEAEGLKEIDVQVGQEFDHNTMQAVEVVEGEKDNVVVTQRTKGYFFKDRLVRPAMVVVSKTKEEQKEETSNEASMN